MENIECGSATPTNDEHFSSSSPILAEDQDCFAASSGPVLYPVTTKQSPVRCIMHEDEGCENFVHKYFNRYTAICKTCSTSLNEKMKLNPFPLDLCPYCHQPSGAAPLAPC